MRILSSGSGRGARGGFDFAEATSGAQSNSAAQRRTQTLRPPQDPNNPARGVIKGLQIVIGDTRVIRNAQSVDESRGDITVLVGGNVFELKRSMNSSAAAADLLRLFLRRSSVAKRRLGVELLVSHSRVFM